MPQNKVSSECKIVLTKSDYLEQELYTLLQKNHSVFAFIAESALDGIWYLDLQEFDTMWINKQFWSTLGYKTTPTKYLPHWNEILHPDDQALFHTYIQRYRENDEYIYDHTLRYVHKNGSTLWIRSRGYLIDDDEGTPIRMLGAHTDMTMAKQTELKLKKQVEKYQHLVEGTHIGTWEWNVQTGEVVLNDRWAEMLGYTLTDLVPVSFSTWKDNVHPDDYVRVRKLLQEYFNDPKVIYEYEARMKHKENRWIWVRNKGKIISWTADGKPEWMIGTQSDITKDKSIIEKQKMFIELAPSAMAMLDTQMRYIAHSKKWIKDYKIDQNIIGKTHYEIFPEIKEQWKQDHIDCLNGASLRNEEDRFVRQDGTIQWLSWELHPWYTSDNVIGGCIMLTQDITKAKETELQLRISEQKFRNNFNYAAIGMCIISPEEEWIDCNSAWCEMLGYKDTLLSYTSFQRIIHPHSYLEVRSMMNQMLSYEKDAPTHVHLEVKFIHKDSTIIYTLLSISLVRGENNNPLYFILQSTNITPRVLARHKLNATISRLNSVLEASSEVGVIVVNTYGYVTSFNKGAENLLGYKKSDVLQKMHYTFFHSENEIKQNSETLVDTIKEKFSVFTRLSKVKDNGQEWTYVRRDGSCFPVQLAITQIMEDDQVTGYLFVATDITRLKTVEQEAFSLLNVANEQNTRLKNFAHIVSHNLKSHSGNFSMLLDLYDRECPEEAQNDLIQMFRTASDDLSETISHLNEVVLMNTAVTHNLKEIDLHLAITRIVDSISMKASRSDVVLHNEIVPGTKVWAIAAYLDSIILNLLTNAIKYRSEKRNSFVKIRANSENCGVLLSVEDNGLGIDLKKHHAKLFGMYTTFHTHKESRGIGLFITKNQVEAMGGQIEVCSEVDKGTTFQVTLSSLPKQTIKKPSNHLSSFM